MLVFASAVRPVLSAPDWAQAAPGYIVEFPRDHGSHPDRRIEWWYFTGNLSAEGGVRFGYQLTFFRIGIDSQPKSSSPWVVRDLHMAHFAISDLTHRQYRSAQRLDRAGPDWAKAQKDRLDVWQENWSAAMAADGSVSLTASEEQAGQPFSMRLSLQGGRAAVLHGDRGYSRKGLIPGNASIYYSFTRMPTEGELVLGDRRFAVKGDSWMDHEFGTSFLEPGQQGWDWFSLQKSDGGELMLFQLRRADGSLDPNASGTFIRPDGSTRRLVPGDFQLVPGRTWKSSATGAAYPVEWKITVPSEKLTLTVKTPLESQEMHGGPQSAGPSYWEGGIEFSGQWGGAPVVGRGYLEMTGYGSQRISSFFAAPE